MQQHVHISEERPTHGKGSYGMFTNASSVDQSTHRPVSCSVLSQSTIHILYMPSL